MTTKEEEPNLHKNECDAFFLSALFHFILKKLSYNAYVEKIKQELRDAESFLQEYVAAKQSVTNKAMLYCHFTNSDSYGRGPLGYKPASRHKNKTSVNVFSTLRPPTTLEGTDLMTLPHSSREALSCSTPDTEHPTLNKTLNWFFL